MPTTHGESIGSGTPEYRAWTALIGRCATHNKDVNVNWRHYGGRGITVCARWRTSFKAFLEDMGRRPSPQHSIDRIDNDGNYEPGNVRWATATEQNRNRRPGTKAISHKVEPFSQVKERAVPKSDYSSWIPKHEAAAMVGVSTKTIEHLAKTGKIQQARWQRPSGGPAITVYEPSDVERAAHVRNASKPFIADADANGNGHELAVGPPSTRRPDAELLRGLEALRTALDYTTAARGTTTIFLSLKDAAAVCGLSETFLRRAITDGKLPALRDRGWRVRRADLEKL